MIRIESVLDRGVRRRCSASSVGIIFGVALQQALKGQGVTELGIPVATLLSTWSARRWPASSRRPLPARRASRLNVLQAIATE